MNRIITRTTMLCIVLSTALAIPLLAQQTPSPIEAKLVVPDTKLLPGVPFDMWVDVHNPSDSTVTVGLYVTLLVRLDKGESFEVAPLRGEGNRPPILLRDAEKAPVHYLTLRPHQQQTLTLPVEDELAGPVVLRDDRLSNPGHYVIALRLDAWPRIDAPVSYFGPVLTDEVPIERIEPLGTDAKVWQRMQTLTNGHWVPIQWLNWPGAKSGDAQRFINEILTKYPDSHYVPYALLASSFGGVTDGYLKRVLEAIDRFPDSPVSELLHLQAWGTATSARRGTVMNAEATKVQNSKRPTTRIRVFGREDTAPPCPPDYDCEP